MPDSTAQKSAAPASGTAVVAVKTALCVIAFLATAALFAYACKELMTDYSLVFTPTKELTLPWLIRMGAGAFLFLLTFAVTAILVRPVWLAAAALAAGMAAYALVLGGGAAAWVGAGVGTVMLVSLLYSVVGQLENQVAFSVRPVGDKELVLSSILAILIAVPVGLGYYVDAERGGYVIPPQIDAYIESQSNLYVGKVLDAQMIPAPLRGAATAAAKEQVKAMVKGFDKAAEPYARYVPYALGALAYFSFQIALYVPGFAASLLLAPVVLVLRIVGFAHLSEEKRVVTRLTLAREGEEAPEAKGPDPWAKAN